MQNPNIFRWKFVFHYFQIIILEEFQKAFFVNL